MLIILADVVLGIPEFSLLAAIENSQLVCLLPAGVLNLVMFVRREVMRSIPVCSSVQARVMLICLISELKFHLLIHLYIVCLNLTLKALMARDQLSTLFFLFFITVFARMMLCKRPLCIMILAQTMSA